MLRSPFFSLLPHSFTCNHFIFQKKKYFNLLSNWQLLSQYIGKNIEKKEINSTASD